MIRKYFLYKNYINKIFKNKVRFYLTLTGLVIPSFLICISMIFSSNLINEEFIRILPYKTQNIIILETGKINYDIYERLNKITDISTKLELRSGLARFVKTKDFKNTELNIAVSEICINKNSIGYTPESGNQTDRYEAFMLYGNSFTIKQLDEGENVVIIDTSLARLLFGRENVVGEMLIFPIMKENPENLDIVLDHYKYYRIVGVLNSSSISKKQFELINDHNMHNDTYSFNIYTPMTCPIGNDFDDYNVSIVATSKSSYKPIFSEIRDILFKHNYLSEYKITDFDILLQHIKFKNDVNQKIIMLAVVFIFFISGLFIMNIMFFSVKERTSEIGIRKTIGAYKEDIIEQFVFEGLLYGIIGGGIGSGLSVILSQLFLAVWGNKYFTVNVLIIKKEFIITALACSCLIGITASVIPAFYAASKNPIDSIRKE